MSGPPDDYDDYDEAECWNCGGEGYVYGCSWDWQCDTYDEGEGSCLCTSRCGFCNPAPRNAELDKIMADALARPASVDTQPKAGDASSEAPLATSAVPNEDSADAQPTQESTP
jgi:hypothetical protein